MKSVNKGHKLIITIVKKGQAKKIVKASKQAGAEGGTVIFGRGTGVHENKSFLGIPIVPEKELILTLTTSDISDRVISAIEDEGRLCTPGSGLAIVIGTKAITGIAHLLGISTHSTQYLEGKTAVEKQAVLYDLIVTIVNKGDSDDVVDASKKAGAEGGTIISGRGTGIHEQAKLFNILIEPEKDIVLTLVDREKTKQVLEQIEEDVELNKPGKGIAFVLEVERTIGINHILNKMINDKFDQS
ncbi:PII family protein [Anaerobacillus alkaliphilus]|uniref:PII family protein n=1 Tax=Anaerobacillus alkaliphilus TaxID=1548597 RepID=A0A4Q0VMT4_9BACI|nr:P-II family nitrogen regulator [Anaerobacillus alkaliphilus]RXI95555.1 PII family protein [Anaerobacillus alkaliphilus]